MAAALVVLVLTAAPAAGAAAGRPGTLDRSFAGGTVTRGFGTVPGRGGAVETAPMPDGGFVVRTDFGAIGRFFVDGSLDRGFGDDGYLIGLEPEKIATTAAGRIYVLAFGREGLQLSRLLPSSKPDPSFAGSGTLALGPKAPPVDAMLIAASGAVFLVGTNYESDDIAVVATRIRPGGSIDPAYGHHGLARDTYPRGTISERFFYALAGERLTVVANGGTYSRGAGPSHRTLVLDRFEPNGSVDRSFHGSIEIVTARFEGEPIGIAAAADGEVLVVGAAGNLTRLSAAGAYLPGTALDEAAAEQIAQLASFSTFAVQPDGRVLIGGTTRSGARLGLVRLDPDGTLDRSFGAGTGFVTAGVEVGEGKPTLTTLAGGDLLLSGETNEDPAAIAAVRLTADGAFVPGFGSGGNLISRPVAYSADKVNAIAAGPDGGALATGTARGRIVVADYLANGRPDRSFAGRGILLTTTTEGAAEEQGTAIARYPGGRILVGTASTAGASLIMLGRHGAPTRSFGRDGVARLADFDQVNTIAVTGSGAILVAGSSRHPCRNQVERIGPGGGVDRSFGSADGAAPIARGCTEKNRLDLAVRPGGGLVVAVGNTKKIVELTAAGRPSPRFELGEDAYSSLPKHLGAIALDRRGRLLVGGTLFHRLGLIRLNRGGGLDRSFGRGGIVTREVGREARVSALALEPDGRILATGIANACPPLYCHGPTAAIARFDPDGDADREFGREGVWTGGRETSALDSLALGAEGSLFAGGWSTVRHDRNLLLVKVRR
jgi:uncharacterized delta-60 repeat protein